MTKIILAFPCMGKTYYAKNHPEKALDLESSDYLFDRTDYEHLTSEEFKGIPNRKPKENGLIDYLKAIDEAVFYDIMHGDSKPTFENYSKYFNFTENFAYKDGDNAIPNTSIYDAALSIFNNSYVFQSYNFVQWLLKHDAVINERIARTKHKYNTDVDSMDNFTILGQLDPDYKLTLSYW